MRTISLLVLIAVVTFFADRHFALSADKAVTHTVVIEAMKFTPESLTVKSGDTVIWVNKDFFPHTATGEKKEFDSGNIASNSSWQYKAIKTGTFSYICTLHPTMKGKVTVSKF